VLAAIVAACRHGLDGTLVPPEPVKGSAYTALEGPGLPRTLDAAVEVFTSSTLAAGLLGPAVVQHYGTAAQHEVDALRYVVTDAERRRGFTRA
jgi:glutamine synthetase